MGMLSSFISQTFPPKPQWSVDNIPDLTGKVAIVTGATDGIGKAVAQALLQKNAKVYIFARSESKAKVVIEELLNATKKDESKMKFVQLELSSLKSIKQAVEDFLKQEQRIDMLFNNGGVLSGPSLEALTEDGFDMTFGVNVVGPFYLTQLLMPTLLASVKTSPDKNVRIVETASFAHWEYPKITYEALRPAKGSAEDKKRQAIGDGLYGQSKFGTILHATHLAALYGDQGIVTTSLHPGVISTPMSAQFKGVKAIVISAVAYSVDFGRLSPLFAGTAPEAASWNGKHVVPWAREGTPHAGAQDPVAAKKLWVWLEEEVKKSGFKV